MGQHRAAQKTEAEAAAFRGSGEVREAPEPAPESAGKFPLFETAAPSGVAEPVSLSKTPPTEPVVAEAPREVTTPGAGGQVDPTPVAVVAVETPKRLGPAILHVTTVPLAEILLKDAGGERPLGFADVAGSFSLSPPPRGEFRLVVRHADYLPAESDSVPEAASGEVVERLIMPEPRPASLVLLTDAGVTAAIDGRKVGGYAVMLGNLPSRRDLRLVLVGRDGAERVETLRLSPRESRLLDRRTPAPAPYSAVDIARARLKGAPIAVKVVSASSASGLVALAPVAGKVAPLAEGASGRVTFGARGESLPLKCERVFGGVSVCRGESVPAGLAPGAEGELKR